MSSIAVQIDALLIFTSHFVDQSHARLFVETTFALVINSFPSTHVRIGVQVASPWYWITNIRECVLMD